MYVTAREQLRRARHSRTFLVESGTGELWSEMQTGKKQNTHIYRLNLKMVLKQSYEKYATYVVVESSTVVVHTGVLVNAQLQGPWFDHWPRLLSV